MVEYGITPPTHTTHTHTNFWTVMAETPRANYQEHVQITFYPFSIIKVLRVGFHTGRIRAELLGNLQPSPDTHSHFLFLSLLPHSSPAS